MILPSHSTRDDQARADQKQKQGHADALAAMQAGDGVRGDHNGGGGGCEGGDDGNDVDGNICDGDGSDCGGGDDDDGGGVVVVVMAAAVVVVMVMVMMIVRWESKKHLGGG